MKLLLLVVIVALFPLELRITLFPNPLFNEERVPTAVVASRSFSLVRYSDKFKVPFSLEVPMTLTNDQIAAGMATQYGRIDQNALRTLAHKVAAQHPEIRAAGIAVAEVLGIEGETAEPFIQAFGGTLVETLMYLGKVPSMSYRIDLLGAPMASPILVATCKEAGLDPNLLPSDFSLEVGNFQVTLKRGGQTTTVWEAGVAQVVAFYQQSLGRFKFIGRAEIPSSVDEAVAFHEIAHSVLPPQERGLAPADLSAPFRCVDEPIDFPVQRDARPAPEPPACLDPFANE